MMIVRQVATTFGLCVGLNLIAAPVAAAENQAGKGNAADAACIAIESEDLEQLTGVLDRNPDAVRLNTAATHVTPLICASQWPEGTRLLLARGADVKVANSEGVTALHEAAANGNEEVVGLLLGAGANIGAREQVRRFTPLLVAAYKGESGVVRLLLDRGADINAKDKDGATALHLAAIEDNRDTVRVLLEHGAKADVKSNGGVTALEVARKQNSDAAVWLLEMYAKWGHDRATTANRLLDASWKGDVAEIERIAGADAELLKATNDLGYSSSRTPIFPSGSSGCSWSFHHGCRPPSFTSGTPAGSAA